ncbi:MAG: hypothetical protein HWE20_17350 [Gammaproteobacteria bacterium]|nr:hypothetical protein [Gammaproteobacteria bacterium]
MRVLLVSFWAIWLGGLSFFWGSLWPHMAEVTALSRLSVYEGVIAEHLWVSIALALMVSIGVAVLSRAISGMTGRTLIAVIGVYVSILWLSYGLCWSYMAMTGSTWTTSEVIFELLLSGALPYWAAFFSLCAGLAYRWP